jgi:mannose-6-phosphate isomerase-like protein (cupin superfamily)
MFDNQRWFMNAYVDIILPRDESAAKVSMMEHKMVAGFAVPLHVHNEDETFYILEGSFRFKAGDQNLELKAGQSLHVPGGLIHAFRVVSSIGRLLTVTTGQFETMVRAASVPAEFPDLPPQAPFTSDDQTRLALICNQNGIEFVGPPID